MRRLRKLEKGTLIWTGVIVALLMVVAPLVADQVFHKTAWFRSNVRVPTGWLRVGQGNPTAALGIGDAYIGGSQEVREDITVTDDQSGGNLQAKSQIRGLPKIGLVALGTMTNGTTETTSYMDDTPTGEWAEVDAGSAVILTADTTYARIGTKSLKIALTANAVAGDGADGTIAQDNLTNNESVGFWIMSSEVLAAGDFTVTLDDTNGTDQVYNIPAVATPYKWQWVEIDISGCDANCDTTDGVKVLLSSAGATNLGAVDIYLDGMWKWDSADEEALGQAITDFGVLSVMTIATAAGSANTPALEVEDTDYFVHYESGSDFIVTAADHSANSGFALIAIN